MASMMKVTVVESVSSIGLEAINDSNIGATIDPELWLTPNQTGGTERIHFADGTTIPAAQHGKYIDPATKQPKQPTSSPRLHTPSVSAGQHAGVSPKPAASAGVITFRLNPRIARHADQAGWLTHRSGAG